MFEAQDCIIQNRMCMKVYLRERAGGKKCSFAYWFFLFIFLLCFTATYRRWISNYCQSNSHNR